jgi:hypothetical protein
MWWTSLRTDFLRVAKRLDPASTAPAAEGTYSANKSLMRFTASP